MRFRLPSATLPLLAVMIGLRLLAQAVLLPAFEGPDEPFHLARAQLFARGEWTAAWQGERLPPDLVAAVAGHPCAPPLGQVFACRELASSGALGNVLDAPTAVATPPPQLLSYGNYEGHQPPLGYLLLAAPVALAEGIARAAGREPVLLGLLAARLAGVAAVLWALLGPLRRRTAGWQPESRAFGLAVLLLPGAAESLARAALEPLLLLWAALLLDRLRRTEGSPVGIFLLAACGPLIKLTAVPVLVFAAVATLGARPGRAGRGRAWAVALALTPAVLVQLVRGWSFGGALDLHAQTEAIAQLSLYELLQGLPWSAAVFGKTALWLGGWSVLRPPGWVLAAFALLLVGVGLQLRPRRDPPAGERGAALVSLAVAAAGFAAFAVVHRSLFGIWGGVAGWYLWAWLPWLALALPALLAWRNRTAPALATTLTLAVALAAQAAWGAASWVAYG